MTRFEAPGKLVLLGEYAVLDGSPALSLAVHHGVSCEVEPGPMSIETPTGDVRFVSAALEAVAAPSARYRFFDTAPFDLPGKPGMGGSGAAVVAALRAGGFAGDGTELMREAIRVHRQVQGSGSGIDVATSALGSVRFDVDGATPIDLPTPVVIWAGNSASTGPRVERYRAWSHREDFVQRSAELVDHFLEDPITTTRAAWRLLVEMSDSAGITYRTPTIERIVAHCERLGGAAKPSGAGGGDAVVAWGVQPEDLEQFVVLPVAAARYEVP